MYKKSVMHVQICCFFDVLVAVAVIVTKVPAKNLPTGDQNVYTYGKYFRIPSEFSK